MRISSLSKPGVMVLEILPDTPSELNFLNNFFCMLEEAVFEKSESRNTPYGFYKITKRCSSIPRPFSKEKST